jgi:predicted RNA-binding Zn-ribbon protein involved in translation (DUF1610 family)
MGEAMTMICDLCGRTGVRWMGPLSNLTHTECPHCGERNCQRGDAADEEDAVEIVAAENAAEDVLAKARGEG